MAQERPVTPEKQLLNLIEESGKGQGVSRASSLKYHGFSLLSPGAWLGRLSYAKAKFAKWVKGEEHVHVEVRTINHALVMLLCALIVYALAYSYNAYSNFRKVVMSGISVARIVAGGKGAQEAPSVPNPVTYYQEKAKERDIFRMGAKKAEPENKEPSSKTLELAQNLRLVGISWSDDPDAMIEDKKLSKTYFIKKGQMVGDATVKTITKDKVVLEVDGEEFELR